MDHIRSILPRVLSKRGIKRHADAAHVLVTAQEWLDTVFPHLKGSLAATRWKHGTLVIQCQNSIAAQELGLQSTELQAHIEQVHPQSGQVAIHIIRS